MTSWLGDFYTWHCFVYTYRSLSMAREFREPLTSCLIASISFSVSYVSVRSYSIGASLATSDGISLLLRNSPGFTNGGSGIRRLFSRCWMNSAVRSNSFSESGRYYLNGSVPVRLNRVGCLRQLFLTGLSNR